MSVVQFHVGNKGEKLAEKNDQNSSRKNKMFFD